MRSFLIKLFFAFLFLIPIFYAVGTQKQAASAATCTIQVTTVGPYLYGDTLNIRIGNADPFTDYLMSIQKPDGSSELITAGSGPIVQDGFFDTQYTVTQPGNYSIFSGNSRTGAPCTPNPITFPVSGTTPSPCTIQVVTANPTTSNPVDVRINNVQGSVNYTLQYFKIPGPVGTQTQTKSSGPVPDGGSITFTIPASYFQTNGAGDYSFSGRNESGNSCSNSPTVHVSEAAPTASCTINKPWLVDAGHRITINGKDFERYAPGVTHSIFLVGIDPPTGQLQIGSLDNIDPDKGIWKDEPEIPDGVQSGKYRVEIEDRGGIVTCGEITVEGIPPPVEGRNPCEGGTCPTALGGIGTTIGAFTTVILRIALGLAGGIALILMVIGAIRVLTSTGNPQAVAGGREIFVAALAGLLFLIFSVLILQFIGVQIVGLQ